MRACVLSCFSPVRLFATPWTVARQAPLSVKFSRQEYWSGLPFPSTRDLPNPGIEPRSPALQADSLPSELPGKPRDQTRIFYVSCISRRVFFITSATWETHSNPAYCLPNSFPFHPSSLSYLFWFPIKMVFLPFPCTSALSIWSPKFQGCLNHVWGLSQEGVTNGN